MTKKCPNQEELIAVRAYCDTLNPPSPLAPRCSYPKCYHPSCEAEIQGGFRNVKVKEPVTC